jgi:transposase InsO family protein
MWKALLRAGEQVGRGRVERLMRTNGLQGAERRVQGAIIGVTPQAAAR